MRFRPCIDLHKGKVKQIVGKTLTDEDIPVENFVSDQDASYYAELFKEDNLTGGHIIMLGKGNEAQAKSALKAYPKGMQIGGGINCDNALYYLDEGASHVIVTSHVFSDGRIQKENLERITKTTGKERLVLDLSCKKKKDGYYVVTDRWQKVTDFKITEYNLKFLEGYCDEFLIHAVDTEGSKKGILCDLVELIAGSAAIPVTYAGGISGFDDIKKIQKFGKGRIDFTIGSSLDIFGGDLPYRQVLEMLQNIDS